MREKSSNIIGMEKEIKLMTSALERGIPVILEGEAGTGKTELAKETAQLLGRDLYRVDGDQELTTMKLQGWFDPPLVLNKGYCWDSFVPGPLCEAMIKGAILFFNEVNRAPAEALNGLLSAIDERVVHIPRLGTIKAEKGFVSIFTMNPLDRVGTNPLPQAFFDRCTWIEIGHLPLEQAMQVVAMRTGVNDERIIRTMCRLAELSRNHPSAESGGSIRAAIFMVKLAREYQQRGDDPYQRDVLLDIARSVLYKKIKLRYDSEITEDELLEEIVDDVLGISREKKTRRKI